MHLKPINILLFCGILLATLIGIPLFGFYYTFTTFDWVLLGVMYLITGMGITIGYHRLGSHQSFECPNWVKRCFLIAGGWALQNSALMWCSDHIRHHARTDTDEDPYNAKRGFWWSHVGWLFYSSPHRKSEYSRRLLHDSVVLWQHQYYWPIVISGLLLPFLLGLWWHGTLEGGVAAFLLGGLLRMVLVLNATFCINSLCHLIGHQPYTTHNSSRDSWFVSLLTLGEGYHNYHHAYARDFRNGVKWYNVDPSKWIIYLLSLCGLATNLRRYNT